jgi:hypothetical protein
MEGVCAGEKGFILKLGDRVYTKVEPPLSPLAASLRASPESCICFNMVRICTLRVSGFDHSVACAGFAITFLYISSVVIPGAWKGRCSSTRGFNMSCTGLRRFAGVVVFIDCACLESVLQLLIKELWSPLRLPLRFEVGSHWLGPPLRTAGRRPVVDLPVLLIGVQLVPTSMQ